MKTPDTTKYLETMFSLADRGWAIDSTRPIRHQDGGIVYRVELVRFDGGDLIAAVGQTAEGALAAAVETAVERLATEAA